MTNYVSRFIPIYATITEPLKELTRQDVTWSWTVRRDQALEELKRHLTGDPVGAYFDPGKKIEIVADASPVELSPEANSSMIRLHQSMPRSIGVLCRAVLSHG